MSGPEGTKRAGDGHEFVTFDLEITNHTNAPQSVGESQLVIPGTWGEEESNLDIDNFGPGNSEYDPEEVFNQPELGVMRTYGPR